MSGGGDSDSEPIDSSPGDSGTTGHEFVTSIRSLFNVLAVDDDVVGKCELSTATLEVLLVLIDAISH